MALIYDVLFDSQTRVLSLLDKAGNVISSCEVPSKELVDNPNKPLMLRAIEDNSSVTLRKVGTLSNTYQTSTNGKDWTDYAFGTKISLNKEDVVYFRCSSHPTTQSRSNYVSFSMIRGIEAWHNAYSMISSSFTNTGDSVGDYGMYYLFGGCNSLTKAPLLVNALSLHCYDDMFDGCKALTQAPELPATTLAENCYEHMFSRCTSLKQAPSLPATTLANNCYKNMFRECTALTQAPALPATTLGDQCYYEMFSGCTALVQAPELPVTTLAQYCYNGMFRGCTSLKQAPSLPATTLANNCYKNMFSGCTALAQAPALPATTLASSCYNEMFSGCTALAQAPALPATTLASSCYNGMFKNCASLTQAPALPATTLEYFCYDLMFNGCSKLKEVRIAATTTAYDALASWLSGVAASGTVYADPNFTGLPENSASGIPNGWTRRDINLINALTLTATADNSSVKLIKNGTINNWYEVNTGSGWQSYTFGTVINLNAGQSCKWRCSAHPTKQSKGSHVQFVMTGTIEASGNCNSMLSSNFESITSLSGYDYAFVLLFYNCTSLMKAPELPATTLTYSCYHGMFEGCSSLTQAPELPATTLAGYCYYGMFYGCSKLKEVRISATTTATSALSNWLKNVSATGDFYCDPDATIFPSGVSGIPVGWNRFVLGAEDTGTTTTMYHNGSHEIVKVGTSSYGYCYALQGWVGFKQLALMHDSGYTLGAQTPLTMYSCDSPVSAYSCDANVDDGFTEPMYDVGNGTGYLTIAQQNANGYYLTATPYTGLTLTATADNSSIRLNKKGKLFNKFEVNTGSGWQSYPFGTVIHLNSGESCKWRCTEHPTTQSKSNYVQFNLRGEFEASGNCNSLLSSDFENITSLSGYCYYALFSGCTALTKSPEIPATTLADSCYYEMFYYTSLMKAPELPATTLTDSCYYGMFDGCSKLKEVRISATTSAPNAPNALYRWLSGVAETGDFYCDPTTTYPSGMSGIPEGWTRHALADYPVTP